MRCWSHIGLLLLMLLMSCSTPAQPKLAIRPSTASPSATSASATAPPTSIERAEVAAKPQLRADEIAAIDRVVNAQLRGGATAGAVVAVIRDRQLTWRKAYGQRSVAPGRAAMTVDTLFDLASLTKPIVTATAIALLADRGALSLDDRVAEHLPAFAAHGKQDITVAQLLSHTSGLSAANAMSDFAKGREQALARIMASRVSNTGRRRYSDVGYIVLGALVERLSGQRLDAFAREHIFTPLGMKSAAFNPTDVTRAAPTEKRAGQWLVGRVHDMRAAALDGVAGHAGLFATVDDVAAFARMMLDDGAPLLQAARAKALRRQLPAQKHALAFSRVAGGYGHTGFTGTSLWLDQQSGAGIIILTSRLHPDGGGDVRDLRNELRTLVIALERARRKQPRVATGIDVLRRDGFAALSGRKVGLVTNHSGRARDGRSTIDLLHAAGNLELIALFSPEHGIRGQRDSQIGDARDKKTGLPIYSLYGKTKRPTPSQLRGIDTLVFDIQDIGARFYTYITTLGYLLETAAKHHLKVVVLDRPNPIGSAIAGPLLDENRRSFIGYHTLPVQHGMTVGELARMYNAERHIVADLQIIALEGWDRSKRFDQTGLSWVNPSPNIRSLDAALLYPGIALLEATNVSVGRGTERPFQQLGAPWVDGAALAAALSDAAGVKVAPIAFTPTSSIYAGKTCHGVSLDITDVERLDAVRLGLLIAHHLRQRHRAAWRGKQLLLLLGNQAAFDQLMAGASVDEVSEGWKAPLAAFAERRRRYLLY